MTNVGGERRCLTGKLSRAGRKAVAPLHFATAVQMLQRISAEAELGLL